MNYFLLHVLLLLLGLKLVKLQAQNRRQKGDGVLIDHWEASVDVFGFASLAGGVGALPDGLISVLLFLGLDLLSRLPLERTRQFLLIKLRETSVMKIGVVLASVRRPANLLALYLNGRQQSVLAVNNRVRDKLRRENGRSRII